MQKSGFALPLAICHRLRGRVAIPRLRRMFQDNALADPALVSYHNYAVRFLTLATFALTAIEGHPYDITGIAMSRTLVDSTAASLATSTYTLIAFFAVVRMSII